MSTKADKIPRNVYKKTPTDLTEALLDSKSNTCAKHLLLKYLSETKLFAISKDELKNREKNMLGPKELIKKVKGKSKTVKRGNVKPSDTEQKTKEKNKQKLANKETKTLIGRLSDYNTCQMIVNPDGDKHSVNKSKYIPEALYALVGLAIVHKNSDGQKEIVLEKLSNMQPKQAESMKNILVEEELFLESNKLPNTIAENVKLVGMEMS